MQLFYFKDVLGNFGDDLNPWVWSRLIPNAIDEDQDTIFIGIGTLINHRIPITPFKHVFGSGVGYGHLPKIDNKFEFHAVRGYESAKALGLSPDKVVTDSAIFVRALFDQSIYEKKWRFGFMPTGANCVVRRHRLRRPRPPAPLAGRRPQHVLRARGLKRR